MPVRVRIGGARGGRGKNSFRIPKLTITIPTENELANAAAQAELAKNKANISEGRDADGKTPTLAPSTIRRRKYKRGGVPGPRPATPFVDTRKLRDGLRATRARGSVAKVVPPVNRRTAVAIMTNRGSNPLGVHEPVLDAVITRFLDAMVT